MEAARAGDVDKFMELVNSGGETKDAKLLRWTRSIFTSQKVILFKASREEELRASLREAEAIMDCKTIDEIALAAATEPVLELAEVIRGIHTFDQGYYVNEFIRAAYDMKLMFRT